jgi:50S ribosomal subunit-associated GTPase HflX
MDRFELILQIFANRAKSHLARYELGLAFLEYSKSLVGKDGGIPVSHFQNLKKFHILK